MARGDDPYKLSGLKIYLWRMVIFLIIAGFIALILYQQIAEAFVSNPGLNGLIIGVLLIGTLLSFRQIIRLFPEIRWVNGFRIGDPEIDVKRAPVLLAPMAALFRDRHSSVGISTHTLRSLLESIATRLDEARDILRYLTGLLVFLGLLGTFWGLLETVSSVGKTIQSLDVGAAGNVFEDLKAGLEAPLAGMGTAFSSSLFGLAGSLVLGFLDLQANQAQTRFYTDLEDWLSSVTDLDSDYEGQSTGNALEDLRIAIDRLHRSIGENSGGTSRNASTAMANLAEGIQGLVNHIRSEQQIVREWMERQSVQQDDLAQTIKALNDRLNRGA